MTDDEFLSKKSDTNSIKHSQIIGDAATTKDWLNVGIYADAIAEFLADKGTMAPLSISIQAPWGGGKTSLMKMIRERLEKGRYTYPALGTSKPMTFRRFMTFLRKRGMTKEVKIDYTTYPLKPGIMLPTIWFNPWKYENGHKLWAGLSDCIVRSIIDKMEPGERELLQLKLSMKTQDLRRIFNEVKDFNFFGFLRRIRPWLIAVGIAVGVFAPLFYLLPSIVDMFYSSIFQNLVLPSSELPRLSGLFTFLQSQPVNFTFLQSHPNVNFTFLQSHPIRLSSRELLMVMGNLSENLTNLSTAQNLTNLSPSNLLHLSLRELTNLYYELSKTNFTRYSYVGLTIALSSLLIYLSFRILKIKQLMNKEAVQVSLEKYLKIPEDKNLDLDDVRIALTAIPKSYSAVVVFVDDLDRCTPDTVRQVIDGINSFFTENLPCIFVIAMDSLIVAAALEVAQNQIISKLPEDVTYSSLGRKFMDKFVQLPIMLPPFGKDAIKGYVSSMLTTTSNETNNDTNNETLKQATEVDDTLLAKYSYTPEELSEAAYEFSNNPRDIKRFVNSLRFYPFLLKRFKQNSCNQDLPNKDQIKRWTMLSLRWPSVVRWLYWNPGGTLLYELESTKETDPVRARLKLLEDKAHYNNELLRWQNDIKNLMGIDGIANPNMASIADENLRLFFKREYELDKNERLSSSAGRGVY